MADMAEQIIRLQGSVLALEKWRPEVEQHDREQDDALYAVERKTDKLETLFHHWDKDHETEKRKATKRWTAAFAFLTAIGGDNLWYNIWRYGEPVLSKYMTRGTFWFIITTIGTFLFTYACYIALNSFNTRRKEANHVREIPSITGEDET